jgi:hypothetical protein
MNDILGTGLIILIIGLAVAPFFLLSSQFGAPKRVRKGRDGNDGPVVPVPTDASGPFPGVKNKPDADSKDSASDSDGGGGGDGGGGAD